MNPRITDIVEIVDCIAPFRLAEEWDNVGLQVGDPDATVAKIMVALDAGKEAVDAAIDSGCQLLLTHHPLLFHPQKKIDLREPTGALVAKAVQHSLNIVSLHTNFDIVSGGVNDLLAARLGLFSTTPLSVTSVESLVKLAVFVPKGHEEDVLQALFPFSGFLGNYSECSFQTSGTGTFKPLAGAAPFLGSIGTRQYAEETRIEVLLRAPDVAAARSSLLSAHPYEEPAIDLYPLMNEGRREGFGRIGDLPTAVSLECLADRLKDEFSLEGVRYVGEGCRNVQRIALCGGSGSSLVRCARKQGADVLVTGDVKYHEAREAQMLGLSLVDMGHFASEILMVEGCVARLKTELRDRGLTAELVACKEERDPYRYR
ncbi:MAG: Nif3-like dinuclear metal center hexameric protein [Geobacteraceae bacterium]|nr:Nif3-like dinuclear metal center hexameric protein [Geobacteraceae bacterium]